MTTVEDRIAALEYAVLNLNELPAKLEMVQEVTAIIWRILDDLVPTDVRVEYADDLDRLDEIAHLLL